MSTMMTQTPGTPKDRGTREETALHLEASQVAAQRLRYHARVRLAYIAGGIVAAVVIVGILLVTFLPTLLPQAPAPMILTMPSSAIGTAADKVGNPVTAAPLEGGLTNAMGDAYQPSPPPLVLPTSLEGPSAVQARLSAPTILPMPTSLEGPSAVQAGSAAPTILTMPTSLEGPSTVGAQGPVAMRADAYWQSISYIAMPPLPQRSPDAYWASISNVALPGAPEALSWTTPSGLFTVAPAPVLSPSWMLTGH